MFAYEFANVVDVFLKFDHLHYCNLFQFINELNGIKLMHLKKNCFFNLYKFSSCVHMRPTHCILDKISSNNKHSFITDLPSILYNYNNLIYIIKF